MNYCQRGEVFFLFFSFILPSCGTSLEAVISEQFCSSVVAIIGQSYFSRDVLFRVGRWDSLFPPLALLLLYCWHLRCQYRGWPTPFSVERLFVLLMGCSVVPLGAPPTPPRRRTRLRGRLSRFGLFTCCFVCFFSFFARAVSSLLFFL